MNIDLEKIGFALTGEEQFEDNFLTIRSGTYNMESSQYMAPKYVDMVGFSSSFLNYSYGRIDKSLKELGNNEFINALLDSYREMNHFLFAKYLTTTTTKDATKLFLSNIRNYELYFKRDNLCIVRIEVETYKRVRYKPGEVDGYRYKKETEYKLLLKEKNIDLPTIVCLDYKTDTYLRSILPKGERVEVDEDHYYVQRQYEKYRVTFEDNLKKSFWEKYSAKEHYLLMK